MSDDNVYVVQFTIIFKFKDKLDHRVSKFN